MLLYLLVLIAAHYPGSIHRSPSVDEYSQAFVYKDKSLLGEVVLLAGWKDIDKNNHATPLDGGIYELFLFLPFHT